MKTDRRIWWIGLAVSITLFAGCSTDQVKKQSTGSGTGTGSSTTQTTVETLAGHSHGSAPTSSFPLPSHLNVPTVPSVNSELPPVTIPFTSASSIAPPSSVSSISPSQTTPTSTTPVTTARTTVVPDIVGLTPEDASHQLLASHLNAEWDEVPVAGQVQPAVASTSPASLTALPFGATVTVTVYVSASPTASTTTTTTPPTGTEPPVTSSGSIGVSTGAPSHSGTTVPASTTTTS